MGFLVDCIYTHYIRVNVWLWPTFYVCQEGAADELAGSRLQERRSIHPDDGSCICTMNFASVL